MWEKQLSPCFIQEFQSPAINTQLKPIQGKGFLSTKKQEKGFFWLKMKEGIGWSMSLQRRHQWEVNNMKSLKN